MVAHGDHRKPYFLTLMWIGTIPSGFIFLVTWGIARRFGGRGLVVVAFVAAVLGPVRDYRYMATFPEWGAYAPGLAPAFAISVAYVILGILGHGTMRLPSPCSGRPSSAPAVGTGLKMGPRTTFRRLCQDGTSPVSAISAHKNFFRRAAQSAPSDARRQTSRSVRRSSPPLCYNPGLTKSRQTQSGTSRKSGHVN
jgi:hypothetical protein